MSDHYDILLLGRTGSGKSTTGNKLLGAHEATNEPHIDVTDSGATYRKLNRFKTGDGSESVTARCELLSNDSNEQKVRVLDTPGFSNTQLTKEHGPLKCNQQILQWTLQEQEKQNLAFRRVLYFLPNRGPLERADGALQEEIKVMYDYLREGAFNIMVIIATNKRDMKYQREFDEEDISTTKKVFTAAFETVTGQHLPKCPPILYLSFNETDVWNKMNSYAVIVDEPLKKPLVIKVMEEEDVDTVVRKAKQFNPGRRLQFQDSCAHCASNVTYEVAPSGLMLPVKVKEKGSEMLPEQSKCHPRLVPKYSGMVRYTGGIIHILTLGILVIICRLLGWRTLPWFTNSDKKCLVCEQPPGSSGCSDVGKEIVNLPAEGEGNDNMTSHSTKLDNILKAPKYV